MAGGVRKRGANWSYYFDLGKVDGKRKKKEKGGFRTKKDAEKALAAAMAEYNNAGLHFEPSEVTFADFLDYWFENYVKLNCRHNTQLGYSQIIRDHLKPALGMYKLKALTPLVVQDFVNKKYVNGGYKKSTLVGIVTVLTGSLKYAVVPAALIKDSPANYIKYPKVDSSRSETNRTVISLDDFNRMTERFKGTPHYYALMIGFHTGLRIGEVYGLTWDDIDFNARTLSVNKLIYKRNFGMDIRNIVKVKNKKEEKSAWYFGEPKTVSSVRTIVIGDTLYRVLKEYKTKQLENELLYGEYYIQHYLKDEKDEKGQTIHRIIPVEKSIQCPLKVANLIMRKENGEHSSIDSFKYPAKVIHHDLHIQFNFHSLRHTHATMLIEGGASVKAVQERLGHSNVETTLQTYVHNTEAMEQAAVDVFENAIK